MAAAVAAPAIPSPTVAYMSPNKLIPADLPREAGYSGSTTCDSRENGLGCHFGTYSRPFSLMAAREVWLPIRPQTWRRHLQRMPIGVAEIQAGPATRPADPALQRNVLTDQM